MNNLENEALRQEALKFSESEDSVAGRAARQLADVLGEQLKRTKFSSGVFSEDCTSFLSIRDDKLNTLDKGVIVQFFKQCDENKAGDVIKRFVEICTSPWFKISVKRLSFLGEQLANVGFKEDGALCFERAKTLVLEGIPNAESGT